MHDRPDFSLRYIKETHLLFSFLLPLLLLSLPPLIFSIINQFTFVSNINQSKNMKRSKRRLASPTLFTILLIVLTSTGSTFIAEGNVPDIDPGTGQRSLCSRSPTFLLSTPTRSFFPSSVVTQLFFFTKRSLTFYFNRVPEGDMQIIDQTDTPFNTVQAPFMQRPIRNRIWATVCHRDERQRRRQLSLAR